MRREKTVPFGINLMRVPVSYQAAQGLIDVKVLARPVVPAISSRAYPYMYRPMLAAINGLSLQVREYNYTAMSSPAVSFLLKQEGSHTHMQGWSRPWKAATLARG